LCSLQNRSLKPKLVEKNIPKKVIKKGALAAFIIPPDGPNKI
jgi:hypothetical protein